MCAGRRLVFSDTHGTAPICCSPERVSTWFELFTLTFEHIYKLEPLKRSSFPQITRSSGINSCFQQPLNHRHTHWSCIHQSELSPAIFLAAAERHCPPLPQVLLLPQHLFLMKRHAGNVIVMQSDSPRTLNIDGGGSRWCCSLLRRHQRTSREKCVLPEMMEETASPPRLKLTRHWLTVLASNIRIYRTKSLLWLKFESN